MAVNEYQVGDLVRCSTLFTNADDVATDPDNVFMQYRDPAGNITSLEYGVDAAVVRDSAGAYHADVDVDEAGDWWYRFYGVKDDGTFQGANETPFRVVQSRFL